MDLIYANEKLHRVVHDLTTGEDAIVERLRKAGSPYLAILGEDRFPKEVREQWIEISNIFKEDMENKNLTVDQARYVVKKLLYIHFEVKEAVNKS
jgi:hypothetical protein